MRIDSIVQTAYAVSERDNVATALADLYPGIVNIVGENMIKTVRALEIVPCGHKIAIHSINNGDPIYKYGTIVGTATKNIEEGEHVHLHNECSNFDERSSTLDKKTAEPKDLEYRLYFSE